MPLDDLTTSSIFVPALMLAAVFGVAVLTDIRFRRIPNLLVVVGWVCGLGWHLLGAPGNWTFDPASPGAVGAFGAVAGLAALLAFFLPFYAFGWMGAGDVKLMSVVGAFFGASASAWTHLVGVSLIVLATGGLLAVVRMLAARNGATVLDNFRVVFAGCAARASGMPGPTFDSRADSADRMPYAVAIATGTTFYVVAKWAGWMKWL